MRRHLFPVLLLVAAACGPETSYVDARLDGTVQGKPVKLHFRSAATLGGLDSMVQRGMVGATNQERDLSQTMILMEENNGSVDIETWEGMESVDGVSTYADGLPPGPLRAGDWAPRTLSFQFWKDADDVDAEQLIELSGTPVLTYDEFEWVNEEKIKAIVRGRISGNLAPDMKIDGTFQFVADCSWSSYFRMCGNPRGDFPEVRRPWQENDCPAEIFDLFAEPHTFGTASMKSRGATFDCDEGDTFCHASLDDVSADGCTWHVEALTDGGTQQFAIAGWAMPGCAREKKYCNTWR